MSCFAHNEEFRQRFRSGFQSQPFMFSHNLADNELFSLAAIKRVARRVATRTQDRPRGFFVAPGCEQLEWGSAAFVQALENALENVATSKARVKLSSINLEPEYTDIF